MAVAHSVRSGLGSRVHASLLTPDLRGGVPRRPAILNGTLTAAVFQATYIWWVIGLGIGVHWVMAQMTKRDKEWFQIAVKYWKTPRVYTV